MAEETSTNKVSEDAAALADIRQFISDAKSKAEDFIAVARRSWREIEKRNERGRLYGGNDLDRRRMWNKFPLWWVTWKIRQPLSLARLSVPILEDTQGDDPIGRTACILGERLARGILKSFDAFPEFAASVDDFLVTNLGWGHWCYSCKEVLEDEKIRLLVLSPEQEGSPPIYTTPDSQPVAEPLFDDMGAYILSGNQVTVENEKVYFQAGVYSSLYVDPAALRWNQVQRIGYQEEYSYREFKQKFGEPAMEKLALGDITKYQNGEPIIVYQYQDKAEKVVRWLTESSESFFTPAALAELNAQGSEPLEPKEGSEAKAEDIIGLEGFFTCTKPLIINAPTTNFWPTSEYFQLRDILDDINQIVKRMMLLTKAMRIRFFFDSSIPQLQSLIGETGEGGGIGIPNLEQSLIAGKGDIRNLVAVFPVDEFIKGLSNLYIAYDQRLNMYYQLTGMSELIRGQTSDVEKTYGERQLEGKFALNRFEPFQRQIQEWLKANYELGMEMALKLFSDKTLDEYIVPQTLDPEDKQRYIPALELLKNSFKRRFRVNFETDSTIQINQEWRRKQAIDLANVLTKALESTANVAKEQPELAQTELKILKHLIGEFSDGKLFIDEIQDSIEQAIEKASQPQQPQPNIDLERLKLEAQKLSADNQFKSMSLQMNTQIEYAKLSQKSQADSLKAQLEQLKLGISNGASQVETQMLIQKIQNEIAQGWEELSLKKEALLANIQSEVGKREMEQFRTVLDARVKAQEISLAEAEQQLENYRVNLEAQNNSASLQERISTEQRLQEEHQANMTARGIDAAATLMDSMKTEPPAQAPITIDASKTLNIKAPAVKSAKSKKEKVNERA